MSPPALGAMRIPPALIRACTAAVICCLVAPALALAADGESTPLDLSGADEGPAKTVGTSGGSIVRTIVGLAIVIAVI